MLNTSNDQRKLLPNFDQLFTSTARAPGGVARLRELILTLAVQGKLVPQDANDEPASELLKKIRAEKDRLIAEGKIKKDKPLTVLGDEEKPFDLPAGWEWVGFRDIGDWAIGSGFPKNIQGNNNLPYPFIKVSDMNLEGNEKFIINANNYVSDEDIKNFKINIHKPGTVIFPKIGGAIATNKRRILSNKTAIDNNCLGITPNSSFESEYLYLFLCSIDFTKYQVGTSVPALSQGTLEKILFGLPPLAEQSRIVTRVEELMGLCDALEEKGRLEHAQHQQLLQAMLDSLTKTQSAQELARHWQRLAQHFDLLIDRPEAVDALEQTILQLAVRGLLVAQDANDEPASELLKKIRSEKDRLIAEGEIKREKPLPSISDEKKPFCVPSSWKWVHLQDICTQITDGTHQTPAYTELGRPFLSAKNIKPFRFSPYPHRTVSEEHFHALRKGRVPEFGDILMTRVGAMIGEAAEIDIDIEFAFYVSLSLLKLPKSFVFSKFLVMWLNSPYGTSNSIEKTLGRGVSAGNLNLSFIRSFAIPFPPLAEQSRIVARVTELRALCQQLRDKLTQARSTQTQLAQTWVEQAAA
ncbi:restriction endonuclease subunit S [Comamonas sp. CMM02]|uniref:restriction endonuclease subunit S n=1 Tax=Comamonas sp. CMM02 TaxID=2769307 RepID=UPI00177F2E8A|nr:restriction endonuclease subunit S [Comamonas sp. CMM02]MBD9402305.1 restriction endonuclease subunit S [Comamonas sp. CMM02]